VPALVTAGGRDEMCPPDTIRPLVDRLAGTRCYCLLAEAGHSYRPEFLALAKAWFDLYA
jgi:predicted esterase